MIDPKEFTKALKKNNLGPVVEVPCSYFKDFLNYLWQSREIEVINPVSENIAIGIASGSYLGSGKIPILAIQNSGFMSTLNALTSLNQIYNIPVFYMVTWRGEGGIGKDAPEHDITGEKLLKFLKTFDLPHQIIDEKKYPQQIKELVKIAKKTKKPVVLVIRKNTFEQFKLKTKKQKYEMTRFDAISLIKKELGSKVLYISGTGFPTRDSFNIKDTPDFYIVGSMGHALAIALGVSPNTKKKIVVLDGDGGALMHAGGMASIDRFKNKNIIYVVLDNGSYESTGGQKTVSEKVDFLKLSTSFGFSKFYEAKTSKELKNSIKKTLKLREPSFLHIKISNSNGEASKRVSDKYSCETIKTRFMRNL